MINFGKNIGLRLDYAWYGLRLVYAWSTLGLRLVYAWQAHLLSLARFLPGSAGIPDSF